MTDHAGRNRPKLTSLAVAQIVAAAEAGEPIPSIAERFGVTYGAVKYRIDTYGPQPVEPRVRLDRHPVPVAPRLEAMGEWVEDGVCRQIDPDLWFPEGKGTHSGKYAKAMCKTCPVLATCREWAIDNAEPWGVWGGMDERERAKERTRREVQAA